MKICVEMPNSCVRRPCPFAVIKLVETPLEPKSMSPVAGLGNINSLGILEADQDNALDVWRKLCGGKGSRTAKNIHLYSFTSDLILSCN